MQEGMKDFRQVQEDLLIALKIFVLYQIDIIHESDWWKELIDEAVDRRLAEREQHD